MRILYDHQIFAFQKYGGVSRYFVELASRIHRYADANVRVVAPLYRNEYLASKSDEIPVLGIHCAGDFRGATRIMRGFDSSFSRILSAAYKPDISHETYYSHNRTSSASVKTVVTVYDTVHELFPEYFPMSKITIEIRKAVYRRIDYVICISENTRTDLIKLYGVNPEKVSVIHLASSITAPIEPFVSIAEPYFLYVGDRGGYKNFLGLLSALACSHLYKTHKLVCFGGGALRSSEQERLSQLGIPNDRVLFIGGDDALLAKYYAAAEAFVYPSLYEGFGIPLLEAMECSCPVLCSNNSSLPEVAGDAAIYFDARDTQDMSNAMLRVVQSSGERHRLISLGKRRVKQFSWDICARQTYAVYEKVLSKQ